MPKKRYQKMEQIDHCLARSDMYVGSTKLRKIREYVGYQENGQYHIVSEELTSSPAILRIFVEALSNAIDNVERSKKTSTPCTKIKVSINQESGETSIWNDGDVVPIEIDPDENCYIHSMIFGQLLTGSNYDDEEERIISGRNGLGIKACLKKGTLVPKFDGNIVKIEDIVIGDEVIGDDGTRRIVINKCEGNGRLFEISQPRGKSYIVNEQHLLSLRMPDHKVIFWNTAKNGWSILWLDKTTKMIRSKHMSVLPPKIQCPECKTFLSGNLNRHYSRIHTEKSLPVLERLSPTVIPPDIPEVQKTLDEMKEFASTIPDDNTLDISVKEYMKLTPTMKSRLSGYVSNCVLWEKTPVKLDPYVLGLWLGDGYQHGYAFVINNEEDPEILEYLNEWGTKNDAKFKQSPTDRISYSISSASKSGKAPLKKLLAEYGLINNKHIPLDYIVNSEEIRLAVLAGLIDSDGTVQTEGRRIIIAQGMEHSRLANDIVFLAKTLGFMCSYHVKKTQWKYKGEFRSGNAININISGNGIEYIPTKVARKKCFAPLKREVCNTGKLTVREVDTGDYIGIEVDGPTKRFVLEDFTVTHNCNIFSSTFRVSGCDPKNRKILVQEWSGNMKQTQGPIIKDTKLKKGYTEVTWTPDFSRFGLKGYTSDIVRLYTRYVIDAAMLSKVDVYLNDQIIPVHNLSEYAKLYDCHTDEKLYIKTKDAEVLLTPANEYQTISFVNGVYTRLGGQHVEAWSEALFRPIVDKFNGKDKKTKTKTPKINITDVKQFFRLFVVSTVIRPEFNGQEKCLDPETPILTWNNGKKLAKDICLGDSLIGNDGLPHKVVKITQGNDLMYEISQSRGDTYTVNSQHTLCMFCPEHKKINFQPKNNLYTLRWYDTTTNNIRIKRVKVSENKTRDEALKDIKDYAKQIPDNNIFDIPLQLYLSLNKRTKLTLYGFKMRVPILWNPQPVFLDPYILGMWLGDGDAKGRAFTSADKELIDYWSMWGKKNNASIVHYGRYYYGVVNYEGTTNNINHKKFKNPLEEQLKQYNLIHNKHIPVEYIQNSQEVRLQVLAGIVDTDGCVQDNGTSLIIVQGMNHTKLIEDIIILVKSIGLNCLHHIKNTSWNHNFEVKTGKAHHLHISGNLDIIPVKLYRKIGKKPSITTGISSIKVNKKTYGSYIGFELENHSRFLLGDFTVTHNCKLESPSVEAEVKRTHLAAITKWSVMDNIEDIIRSKEMIVLKKVEKVSKKQKIEGYDPANKAGTKDSLNCSLFITEGLSAKTYVVAGIKVGVYGRSGRDWNGVLPVRGKILNVRDKSANIIADNKVICSLIQALGLKHDVDYTDDNNFKKLNYGKLFSVTDADCFTKDTPCLVKINDNEVDIISCESLYQKINTKESLKIWSVDGWTNILAVKRKITTKNIIQITTSCGLVRCTDDHKMILENGEEIQAKYLKLGDRLLRTRRIEKPNIDIDDNITDIKTLLSKYQCYKKSEARNKKVMVELINNEGKFCQYNDTPVKNNISIDEAFVWGMFFAEGSCDIYTFIKDRQKETQNNMRKSRERWEKWIQKYESRLIELSIKAILTNSEKKLLYDTRKRLKNAEKMTFRKSIEKSKELYRTNYCWAISNCDFNLLEKCYNIMSIIYPSYSWSILTCKRNDEKYKPIYKLIINGGKKTEDFINNFREKFYDKNNRSHKKIPIDILNSDKNIQRSFIDGYYAGDGFRYLKDTKNAMGFDILGQIGAQGLCYILEKLGYCVNIHNKKNDIFTIHFSDRFRRLYPGEIKDIRNIEYTDDVYDIETENHTLNVGIGGLVVHNCDGLHIEALLMNFLHALYPSLLKREEPFFISLKTPIARVKQPKQNDILFYDENNFNSWLANQTKKWDIKYYKGLGTTRTEDVPDTFGNKLIEFMLDEHSTENMHKAFDKKYADHRKNWLAEYIPSENKYVSIDTMGKISKMSISNFINGELIKFSHADCARSIPNGIDGLKESQRKILYAVKKRKLKYSSKSLKVAQLGGYTAEHTNYHHGENNLYETIIGMAQEYPGTNNIPLLYRDGLFGTKLEGGEDAAAARYIYTKMDALTELIFREEDEPLLKPVNDDGDLVQPEYYVPILPMILINGCKGIGTGWSCNIPCFNPLDMIKAIRTWLEFDGEVLVEDPDDPSLTISMFNSFTPWYRGFKGDIEKNTDTRFITYGIIEETGKNIDIKELPIGMWTNKFADYLTDLHNDKKLKSVLNYSSPKDVHFSIKEGDNFHADLNTLKLHSYLYTSNMVTFNEKNQLRKYDTVDEIIANFCEVRFEYYVKRKKYQINALEIELKYLGNKERFVTEVIEGKLDIMNVDEEIVIKDLVDKGYDEDPKKENGEGGYDYLLRMQIRTFTANKVKQLKNDIASIQTKLDNLKSTSEQSMWLRELEEFEIAYLKWIDEIDNQVVPTKKVTKKKK